MNSKILPILIIVLIRGGEGILILSMISFIFKYLALLDKNYDPLTVTGSIFGIDSN